MYYLKLETDNMNNGSGLRVVLWVAGCNHGCPGCHNPTTWNAGAGSLFTKDTLSELDTLLGADYIDGITFSGGDPLLESNRAEILDLLKHCKEHFPEKTIWLYTGFELAQITTLEHLKFIDVLVDGKFVEALASPGSPWIGSSNQRVIHLSELRGVL